MALDFGGFSYIGGGIQDLFSASGSAASAGDLRKAASMEDTNAKISAASTEIQHAAATRDIYKVMGGQASDVASAGFTMGGTAMDLARSSAQQGAIAQALIENQGQIDVRSHIIAATNLRSQASAMDRQSQASMFGGIMNIGLGVLSLFMSDERLKENVKFVGLGKRGLRMYEYNYKADPGTKYVGYMAQEVEKVEPDMVIDMGLKMVDSEFAPQKVA